MDPATFLMTRKHNPQVEMMMTQKCKRTFVVETAHATAWLNSASSTSGSDGKADNRRSNQHEIHESDQHDLARGRRRVEDLIEKKLQRISKEPVDRSLRYSVSK